MGTTYKLSMFMYMMMIEFIEDTVVCVTVRVYQITDRLYGVDHSSSQVHFHITKEKQFE